jgi:hypothetical protein
MGIYAAKEYVSNISIIYNNIINMHYKNCNIYTLC